MNGLSSFVEFFVSRWRIYKWQQANTLCSRGKLNEAIDLYRSLDLRDGLKQIALAQIANIYYRLGQKSEAKKFCHKAKASELQWGMRAKPANSLYIIEYCNFYLRMLDVDTMDREMEDWANKKLLTLNNIPVSRDIQVYYLPLPSDKKDIPH